MLDVHHKGRAVVVQRAAGEGRARTCSGSTSTACGPRCSTTTDRARRPREAVASGGPAPAAARSSCTGPDERTLVSRPARRAAGDDHRSRSAGGRRPAVPGRLPRRPRPRGRVPAADARRAGGVEARRASRPSTPCCAAPGRKVQLDEAGLLAFMQAINCVRLVLGTMLDVTEDDPRARRARPARRTPTRRALRSATSTGTSRGCSTRRCTPCRRARDGPWKATGVAASVSCSQQDEAPAPIV